MRRLSLVSLAVVAACAGPAAAPTGQPVVIVTPGGTPYAKDAPTAKPLAATSASAIAPTVVPMAAVTQLAARNDVTCARLADGAVKGNSGTVRPSRAARRPLPSAGS